MHEPLSFRLGVEGAAVTVSRHRVFIVGYAGRDQAAVRAHVEELAAHGVPAPVETPSVWEAPAAAVTQATVIAVPGNRTSGEAEPVLIVTGGTVYVTVGSDHTDRELEREDMIAAKLACQKVVAAACWPLQDVRGQWDDLRIRSEIRSEQGWRSYQDGRLAELLPPEWYVERFAAQGDAVVFCGTVPTIGSLDTRAVAFRAMLGTDQQELTCEYEMVTAR